MIRKSIKIDNYYYEKEVVEKEKQLNKLYDELLELKKHRVCDICNRHYVLAKSASNSKYCSEKCTGVGQMLTNQKLKCSRCDKKNNCDDCSINEIKRILKETIKNLKVNN